MADGFVIKKINMYMTDKIALFTTLYWVENFKSYNKYLFFFARHIGSETRKIPVDDLVSQLVSILQHQYIKRFRQLSIKNPE